MKTSCLTLILALITLGLSAQTKSGKPESSSYTIRVKINGVKDTAVYLANYFGNKIYYNDTAIADKNGLVVFKGKKFEEGGKYAVVIPGPKYFDILVTEEDIDIETDAADFVGKMKINKSLENKLFYDYVKFIDQQKKLRDPIDAQLAEENIKEEQATKLKEELKVINQQVIDYQSKLFRDHPNLLVSKLIMVTTEIEIPEPPADTEDLNWKYHYYINHYWDNTDLNDPRIVRDQGIHRKLETFANNAVAQIPDTVFVEAKKACEKVASNPELFKYFVHFFTSNAEKSKIMCMDRVFVLMVDEYYKSGRTPWMDNEQLAKIIEAADKKRPTMCGETVPNIILPDTSGTNWVSLHGIDAKYTIIAIWESNCGHCKKEMPKLMEIYQKWKDKGVEVYAIGNDFETPEWKKFIREKELSWINVSDNPEINKSDSAMVLIRSGITNLQSLNFRKTFDVFSTPKVYVLDADKKVIAKQLSAEQVEDLLNNLEGSVQNSENSEETEKGKTKFEDKDKSKTRDKKNEGS
jgi:thiol-disulfide isomerase/thioredoxin